VFRELKRREGVTRRNWIRFMSKVFIDSDGHWIWCAGRDKDGYGKFWWHGKEIRAHRFSYTALKGPIPGNLQPDHLCKITSCVNPDCLELVTPTENNTRSDSIMVKQM